MKQKTALEALKEFEKLYDEKSYYDFLKFRHQLICCLPEKDLFELLDTMLYNQKYVALLLKPNSLEKRFAQHQSRKASCVIAQLKKPDCKGKMLLRKQLKLRFLYTTPKSRKEIISFMLEQPTKKEREWAYAKLKSDWDSTFLGKCYSLFEKYKDEKCADLLLKHAPHSFIYAHRDEISEKVGPYMVIRTIGRKYPDAVDLDALDANAKLRAIANLRLTDRRHEVENMLYSNIIAEIEYAWSAGKIKSPNQFERPWVNYGFRQGKYRTIVSDDVFEQSFNEKPDWELPWGKSELGQLPYYFRIPDEPDEKLLNFPNYLSLMSINGTGLGLWAMGKLGMSNEILRFAKLNKELEIQLTYTHDEIPFQIDDWLYKVLSRLTAEGF